MTSAELHPVERAILNVLGGHDALPASEIREALSPKPGMARAYVLLERLESRKFVLVRASAPERFGTTRRLFSITDAGRQALNPTSRR